MYYYKWYIPDAHSPSSDYGKNMYMYVCCIQTNSIHVKLALRVALIHCAICGCMPCCIDFSQGFWYDTLPCPFTFKGAKVLAASMSAVK